MRRATSTQRRIALDHAERMLNVWGWDQFVNFMLPHDVDWDAPWAC